MERFALIWRQGLASYGPRRATMPMLSNDLIHRAVLVEGLGISESSERKHRKDGTDWPPHVLIGRKVYYLRKSLEDWLHGRESHCQSIQGDLTAVDPAPQGDSGDVSK